MLFRNNTLVWKLQFRYVGPLLEISFFSGIVCGIVFTILIAFINIVFLLDVNQDGGCHQQLMFRLE